MATPHDHYLKAERLIERAEAEVDYDRERDLYMQALVHALLARVEVEQGQQS